MPFMGEVIRVLYDICKTFDTPALLWLAAHVEDNLPTPHVVLYRNWRVATLKEHQPVIACRVTSKVLVSDRMSHIRHF